MKYIEKTRISSCLLGSLLVFIVLLSVSQGWARDPVPKVRLRVPSDDLVSALLLPDRFNFAVDSRDEDGVGGKPIMYRYLLKEAVIDGVPIASRYQYEQHKDELIVLDDPQWSEWLDLRFATTENPLITLPSLDVETYYIIAAQVLDADGTASMDFSYGMSVINFRVSTDQFRPVMMAYEQYLGQVQSNSFINIASGQTLNFAITADAGAYGGYIQSLRYGWDIMDPDDPDDPGWETPAGVAGGSIQTEEKIFTEGMHSLVARSVDSFGNVGEYRCNLNVVPFVSPVNQLPLLFIDSVVDANSNRWPNADLSVYYDNEQHRNEYWRFLDGETGVVGFNWERDHVGDTQYVDFQDIVIYKAVMVNARAHSQQIFFQNFRPVNGRDKYVWLNSYQQYGGNLFLVGDRSMESFLEPLEYMVPLVFDTEEELYNLNNETYTVGFGVREDYDGSTYIRGTRMYPYLTAGLSLLDWSVPMAKNIYAREPLASNDRKSACSGIKAMVLAEGFRTHHQISPAVLSDTLWTNPNIDWRETGDDNLDVEFPFTGDEFVDSNVSSRSTPWSVQDCADGVGGLCIEPMFKGVTRFDWLREKRWAAGDANWPNSQYNTDTLNNVCGEMGLIDLETPGGIIPNGTARVNDQIHGYLSYTNVANKPRGKADVYLGFDPYRFDGEDSKKTVHWVLEYFGLQVAR